MVELAPQAGPGLGDSLEQAHGELFEVGEIERAGLLFALAIEVVEAAKHLDEQFALRGIKRGDQRVLGLLDLLPHALEQIRRHCCRACTSADCRRNAAMACSAARGRIGAEYALGAFERTFQMCCCARLQPSQALVADGVQGVVDFVERHAGRGGEVRQLLHAMPAPRIVS